MILLDLLKSQYQFWIWSSFCTMEYAKYIYASDFNNIWSIHAFPGNQTYNPLLMPCEDVNTQKTNSPWMLLRFSDGFLVFQFMSEIRSLVNIGWRYLDILLNNVNHTHTRTPKHFM